MIRFSPSEEQQQIVDMVRRFAAEVVRPRARDCEENGETPEDALAAFWELGLVANGIPEACGGYGYERSAVTGALIAEELAYGDMALAMAMMSPTLFVYPLLEAGTEEQQKAYLPGFCAETFAFATSALMEPRVTFDPSHMRTTARREGDAYVLNGEKCLVPFADRADRFLVFAPSAPGTGMAGVSGFIVEKGTDGLTVGEREKYMGLNALPFHRLHLTHCRVPAAGRLGGSRGCDFQRLLNLSRISMASLAVGLCGAVRDFAVGYAKERVQFGEPIASRQAIAFKLADMAIETDAMRFLTWKAAWLADQGEDCTREAYLAKLYAGEYAATITDDGVQVLGGHGYIREYPVELWFRNGRGIEVLEGLSIV